MQYLQLPLISTFKCSTTFHISVLMFDLPTYQCPGGSLLALDALEIIWIWEYSLCSLLNIRTFNVECPGDLLLALNCAMFWTYTFNVQCPSNSSLALNCAMLCTHTFNVQCPGDALLPLNCAMFWTCTFSVWCLGDSLLALNLCYVMNSYIQCSMSDIQLYRLTKWW